MDLLVEAVVVVRSILGWPGYQSRGIWVHPLMGRCDHRHFLRPVQHDRHRQGSTELVVQPVLWIESINIRGLDRKTYLMMEIVGLVALLLDLLGVVGERL